MALEVLPIPLAPGIRQDTDRTMLPAGSLVASVGTRLRKGSIAKSNGLADAGLDNQGGSTVSGTLNALGYAAGRQINVAGGSVWARQGLSDLWQEVGRASRARPVMTHWAAFTDVGSSQVLQPSCATIGDYVAFAHLDNGGVRVAVMDPSGIRRAAALFPGRDRPRIFAVGTTFVLVMRDTSNGNIYGATINGTTLAISAETFIIAQVVSGDVFDAAPFNSTNWLLASRTGTTIFQIAFGDTSLALGAVQFVAIANNTVTAASVYGTDGENIFTTFAQTTAGVHRIAAFAPDLTSTTLAPTTFSTSAGTTAGVMTRRNSTSAWLVFEESFSSPTRTQLQVRAYHESTGLVAATTAYAWHVRPASRPFLGNSVSLQMWVHTDGGTSLWATNRRYTLVTFSMDQDVPSSFGMFIEPELAPDERSHAQQSSHIPAVAFRSTTDESGGSVIRAYMPALATIRTSDDTQTGTPALLLYEWETDTGFVARSRQVGEVGGQGVVFGGGLQEIASSRINSIGIDDISRGVENGFVFAPVILSATKTATGADGLTVDTLYQFVAVFEYVTPDGLRTRSAPSNIASETPTAGLLNVSLEIATAPTSEREFSSPPNATAIHIYATTGGGNTFQRITPDFGLSAGIGTSTTGIVTYVHSVADSTYRDNEPLYTERGGFANQPAPAHRVGWVGGGYAWVGGLFNPQLIERSKLAVPNEPIQFTRDNSHRCLLPEAFVGGAWLDNVCVVFSRTGVYVVSTTLGAPQRLPSTVGCIDARSIVELPEGLGFQSRRGYELLPRGFGEPRLISGPVEEHLRGRRVISATVTGHAGSNFGDAATFGKRELVLSVIDPTLAGDQGVRLILDLDSGRWLSADPAMADSGTSGEYVTTWDGRLVVAACSGSRLRIEDPTDWGTVEAVPMSVTLADLRPFGLINRGQIARVLLLGEIRSTTEIAITIWEGGKLSDPLEFNQNKQTVSGTAGDKFLLEWNLPTRRFTALTLKFDMRDPTGMTGEGVVLHAVGIEAEGLPGRPRVPQERTAA